MKREEQEKQEKHEEEEGARMSDSFTVTLWGPTAYLASLVLIATPFVLYYTQTAVMYTITPSSCEASLYVNESSW